MLDRIISYQAANDAQMFEYDPNGNRTAKRQQNNLIPYLIEANSNRLVGVGNAAQQLDVNGNLLNDGKFLYTYNEQNRLANVDGIYRYTYNANQQRVQKTTPQGTTLYAWANSRIIGEYDQSGTAKQETVYMGTTPIATIQQGKVYRINPRFPGQLYDAETGLHYNYHRDYNPETGRYVQSDPIGLAGGLNTFGYAGQSPYGYVDPDGLIIKYLKIGYNILKNGNPKKGVIDELEGIVDNVKTLADGQFNADDLFAVVDLVTGFGDEARKATRLFQAPKDGTHYIPKDPLAKQRVNGQDIPLPLKEAEGRAHTVLGSRAGSDGNIYRQSAEFPASVWPKANGKNVPMSEVHWSSHGRSDHLNPHQHPFTFDGDGWIRQGGNGLPFKP